MKRVEPIRDKKKIEQIKAILKAQSDRNYMIFVVGINTGLRISDLLSLKVEHIRYKRHIMIIEKKTSKIKQFLINSYLRRELDEYMKDMDDYEYLFQSRIGKNKPLSRFQAHRIMKEVGREVNLERIACTTTRKTFGYHHYKQYKDLALLQKLFNHSKQWVTLDYIGINQDMMDESIENFRL
ncbi:site-specific integrase [Halanaerobium hydrogeniformans]|uniref:Integrase family protein n=1 Tax=Halanaerobium hydrogeniformans TaxID=656519 RepID=E4RNK1_HALHG|nr:site-specific integrase [Halanaerobium hydrogeniformans]ADQ13536.1 integrase family protein [Halanaerobium hydrogeniformans]